MHLITGFERSEIIEIAERIESLCAAGGRMGYPQPESIDTIQD
ncbi:hypothetical protein OH799_05100 [Nocardia sp. NBC_00881]|nr:hypothetical protein OH799_05100 [Nocardia sp. NBC_00881]